MAINNTLRSRATQAQVLKAFADKLIADPDFNEVSVVVADQPVPTEFVKSSGPQIFLAPGDSVFDISAGAHHESWTEMTGLIVGIYCRNIRDRVGRAESRLINRDALTQWKRLVMRCLALESPSLGHASRPWEPTAVMNGVAVPLLRAFPLPTKATSPRDVDKQEGWIGMQIYYSLEFDWDFQ